MLKVCKWCGKEFETPNKQSRYCSDECRKEVIKKTSRESKRKTYKELKKIKKCKWCGKEFTDKYRRSYCSAECQKEANRKRSRDDYEQKYKHIERKTKKKTRERSFEQRSKSIARKNELARQQGMSYGEWVALKTIMETRIRL